ncbi:MAG: acyltransferase [Rhodopirellula sp. JB044]|uniref:acyltransferase n=1 Tax=Rhodopirellula sp. JB044 TaxID=3342844 RepID=UPI00370B33F6
MKSSIHLDADRDAFMLFEILIALTFLVIASGIILKVHQSRLDFDRASNQRLVDQLAIENAAEQLSHVPFSELNQNASNIGGNSDVQITTEAFTSGTTNGRHLLISVESGNSTLTHHLWRFEESE